MAPEPATYHGDRADDTGRSLLERIRLLEERLSEADATLRAIRDGEVDALVVYPRPRATPQVFTLHTADTPYRVLIESVNEGALTVSPEGHVLYANTHMAAMLRTPIGEIVGGDLRAFVMPRDQPLLEALLVEARKTSVRGELQLRTADDQALPVQMLLRSVPFDTVAILSVIVTDLTSQELNQQTAAAEQLARSILEQAGEAIIVCNSSGRVIRASHVAQQLCGADPTFHRVGDLFPVTFGPEGLPFPLEAVLRGEVFEGIEVNLRAASGVCHDLLASARPLLDSGRRRIGAVLTLTDITRRKRAEAEREKMAAAAETSRAQMQAVIENMHEGVTIADAQGRIVLMNPATLRLYGFGSLEEVQGRPPGFLAHLLEVRDRDDRLLPPEEWPLGRVIRGQTFSNVELHVRRTDRDHEWFGSYSGAPLPHRPGDPPLFLITIHDLTERRRIEEAVRALNSELERRVAELHEANRDLEAFNYSVSHDLRIPLSIIDGYSHMLLVQHAERLGPEARNDLESIRGGVQKMSDMIEGLLSFSRVGRQALQLAEIDVAELARDTFEDLRLAHKADHVELRIGTVPPTCGDWRMLRQVFMNLLGNAIKFTRGKPQPVIEVSGFRRGDACEYCVRDNGAGFDMRYARKLFGVFQRLHSNEEFEGTGLGLAIVQRIVQRHGGEIWAEAQVNQGAVFHFTLRSEYSVSQMP